MIDVYCALCSRVEGMAASDFAGWLPDGGLDWGQCGGCGWHLLDNDGNPACESGEPTDSTCGRCLALAGECVTAVVAEVRA